MTSLKQVKETGEYRTLGRLSIHFSYKNAWRERPLNWVHVCYFPMLLSCWLQLLYFIFSTLILELKIHHYFNQHFIYHLPQLLPTLLFLAVYRKHVILELSLMASLSMSSHSSGIEHPLSVWGVMGLIPVENSDFSSSHAHIMLIISSLLHLLSSLKFTIFYLSLFRIV